MNKTLARFLLENSPFTPFWNAWCLGLCIVDINGDISLTAAGEEFLDWIAA